ncbi:MAG: extracellular solute-binding protein [Acetivibrio sp.]
MKKRMKVAILCFLLLGLVGCSKNYGLDPKNPQEIVVWHYYNGAQAIAFEELVTEFNRSVGEEEGIIVTAKSQSTIDELISALDAAANKKVGAEEMPNIFESYLDTAVELDKMNILADLDPYVTKEEKEQYMDFYIEEGTFGSQNQWKLFPIAKSTEVLALNKTDFDKFAQAEKVSTEELKTWEGLTRIAEQYYKWSGGKSFFGRDAFANYMIIGSKQLGKEIFTIKDNKATVQMDPKIMKKLWDNFYIPYVKGYFKHVGRYRTDDVKIGEIVALAGSTSGMLYFPTEVTVGDEKPYPIDCQILPLPNFEGTEKCAVQQGANMAVTKSTEKEEYASVLFLKWFTQTERNIKFSVESGYMPVTKEANDPQYMDTFLKEKKITLEGIKRDSIFTSIEQAKSEQLFTTKGFDKGYEARRVLNTSMLDVAIKDRKNVEDKIAAGMAEEDAWKEYVTDRYFMEWFQSVKEELEDICQ